MTMKNTRMKKPPTEAQRLARFKKATRPTIGVGEDKLLGRGQRIGNDPRGSGELGELIPQNQRDTDAIARIDGDQSIRGGGDNFDGEWPDGGM